MSNDSPKPISRRQNHQINRTQKNKLNQQKNTKNLQGSNPDKRINEARQKAKDRLFEAAANSSPEELRKITEKEIQKLYLLIQGNELLTNFDPREKPSFKQVQNKLEEIRREFELLSSKLEKSEEEIISNSSKSKINSFNAPKNECIKFSRKEPADIEEKASGEPVNSLEASSEEEEKKVFEWIQGNEQLFCEFIDRMNEKALKPSAEETKQKMVEESQQSIKNSRKILKYTIIGSLIGAIPIGSLVFAGYLGYLKFTCQALPWSKYPYEPDCETIELMKQIPEKKDLNLLSPQSSGEMPKSLKKISLRPGLTSIRRSI